MKNFGEAKFILGMDIVSRGPSVYPNREGKTHQGDHGEVRHVGQHTLKAPMMHFIEPKELNMIMARWP
jgi:hypothetical protein